MRRRSKMGEVRSWIAQAPASALWWALGVVSAEIIVRILDPAIALIAASIRTLLGL